MPEPGQRTIPVHDIRRIAHLALYLRFVGDLVERYQAEEGRYLGPFARDEISRDAYSWASSFVDRYSWITIEEADQGITVEVKEGADCG